MLFAMVPISRAAKYPGWDSPGFSDGFLGSLPTSTPTAAGRENQFILGVISCSCYLARLASIE
jgi:hypothetical protein